ncbi:transposase [Pluralibacter gergoviae]|nr:transposase [Pluralibacter gergoviae]
MPGSSFLTICTASGRYQKAIAMTPGAGGISKKGLPAPCMALISGSRAFGNILFATTMILFGTKTTAISIRSSMAGSVRCGTGHIRPFTEMSEEDVIPLTGRASVWISPPVSAGKRSDISVHCNAIIDQTGAAMPCKRGFNTESLSALTEALVPPFCRAALRLLRPTKHGCLNILQIQGRSGKRSAT